MYSKYVVLSFVDIYIFFLFNLVRGAEFTAKKISCLEVKARESYLNLLEEQMKENYQKFVHNSMTTENSTKLSEVGKFLCLT